MSFSQDDSVQLTYSSFPFTPTLLDDYATSNLVSNISNILKIDIDTKQNTLTSSTNLLGDGSAITELDWNKITLNKPSLYTTTQTDNLLNAKENNLTFSTPLTRTTNTIGINLNAYVPFTALTASNYITNTTFGLTNYPSYTAINNSNYVPFTALTQSNFANYNQLNNCNYVRHTSLTNSNYVPFTAFASCNYITNSTTELNNYPSYTALNNSNFANYTQLNNCNYVRHTSLTNSNYVPFTALSSCNYIINSVNNLTNYPNYIALNSCNYVPFNALSASNYITNATNALINYPSFTTLNNCNYITGSTNYLQLTGGNLTGNLTTTGNIGIGTTDPGIYKLRIRGSNPATLRIETNNSAPNEVSCIEFGIPAFTSAGSAKITSTARVGDVSDLQFSTSSTTNNSSVKMTIKGDGNVGIGITDPKTLLHITGKTLINNALTAAPANGFYGNNGTRLIMWPGTDTNVAYSLGITTSTLWYAVPTGAIHAFYVGTTERMRINNNGNINVGTTSEYSTATKMHIKGASYGYSQPLVRIEQTAGWDGNYCLQTVGYSDLGGIRINGGDLGNSILKTAATGDMGLTVNNGNILFNVNGAERMRILNNGNITMNGLLTINATNNSYVRCGANTGGYFLNVGSTSSDSSTMYNATSGGIWTSVTGALHINPSTANSIVYINFFNTAGLLSVGGAIAQAKLHVASGTYATGLTTLRYWNVGTTNITLGASFNDICAIFDSSIWCKSSYVAFSSDERIKTNIKDIEDDEALQKILQIQPKTYEYIDKVEKGDNNIYGFIAQQIKEVIPEAVKIQKCIIPNIYKVCNYTNDAEGSHSIITIPDGLIEKLKINDEIDIVIKNDRTKTFNILEIIDDTIKINEVLDENENECFVYGSKVDDFYTLDKNYIYTLNVCATQELYKLIQKQNEIIENLQLQINELKNNL